MWSFHKFAMIWGIMQSTGIKSRVNTAVYQETLEHFTRLSGYKLYGDADFHFQQDCVPAHSAKTTTNWFADRGITMLEWIANRPDLNLVKNL